MQFQPTDISGAVLVVPDRHEDERGFFARTWCAAEFRRAGLRDSLIQCSVSFNRRQGTLRGMHFQQSPHAEVKLVRCTSGAIFDVVLDLREDSSTYLRWQGIELSARNGHGLYLPPGVAHGFQTLVDETEVFYQMADPFVPESARGVRYDDPAFAITWPRDVTVISERDASYPDYASVARDVSHPISFGSERR